MLFPTWLVRLAAPSALIALAAVCGGWKWEGFPH
jgi:hypothetical protein